jgi:phosphodiesterase/alkaline phosphatase D-like protein
MARLSPGMIGQTSIRLRVDDWPNSSIRLRSTVLGQTSVETFALTPVEPPARAGTWILDVDRLAPGTMYKFEIDGLTQPQGPVTIRTPPESLEKGPLLLTLLSCYFPSDEYKENPSHALRCLATRAGDRTDDQVPHLKIFCGDQIYADVPWSWSSERAIEAHARLYRETWGPERLGKLVSCGANVFVSEDHEFWNSFPDAMPHLTRSGGGEWFEWATAAADAAWVEQNIWNFGAAFKGGAERRRGWGSTSLAGVDMFVADTRTDRVSFNGARCYLDTSTMGAHAGGAQRSMMGPDQLKKLTEWASGVERLGLLVIGQPLLAPSTGAWTFDTTLADYEKDYRAIVTALLRKIDKDGVSFIVLTGDIHWGRLVYWSIPHKKRPNAKLVEFVASPLARVGKLKSLLSRNYDVGKPAATKIEGDDWRPLQQLLSGFKETCVFATGENNFGTLTLAKSTDDRRAATFELWGPRSGTPTTNDWNKNTYCRLESLEL